MTGIGLEHIRRGMLAVACVGLTACGSVTYATRASDVSGTLEEARAASAEALAPYDFRFAAAHLEKAREEAAEGDYRRAVRYLETARVHAERARDRARRTALARDPARTAKGDAR